MDYLRANRSPPGAGNGRNSPFAAGLGAQHGDIGQAVPRPGRGRTRDPEQPFAGPAPVTRRLCQRKIVTGVMSWPSRRLHQDGHPVPREVEELTYFLVSQARMRQEASMSANGCENGDAGVADRLLVTKEEAAERLGVSVRTIERLAASGRLPKVHVERSARFRVTDLVAYVDSLAVRYAPAVDDRDDRP